MTVKSGSISGFIAPPSSLTLFLPAAPIFALLENETWRR